MIETINILSERVNYGLHDFSSPFQPACAEQKDDENEPSHVNTSTGCRTVPENLRIWRWELKADCKEGIYGALPDEITKKLESRREECLGVREAAKTLFASLAEHEKQEILTKGQKTTGKAVDAVGKPLEKVKKKNEGPRSNGKTKSAAKEEEDDEDDKGEGSSSGKAVTKVSNLRASPTYI